MCKKSTPDTTQQSIIYSNWLETHFTTYTLYLYFFYTSFHNKNSFKKIGVFKPPRITKTLLSWSSYIQFLKLHRKLVFIDCQLCVWKFLITSYFYLPNTKNEFFSIPTKIKVVKMCGYLLVLIWCITSL